MRAGVALAGEHAGRVLALALEREHAGGERERARAGSPRAASAAARRGRSNRGSATRGTSVPDSDSRSALRGSRVGLDHALGQPVEQVGRVSAVEHVAAASPASPRRRSARCEPRRSATARLADRRASCCRRRAAAACSSVCGVVAADGRRRSRRGSARGRAARSTRRSRSTCRPSTGRQAAVATVGRPCSASTPAQVLVERGDAVVVEPRRRWCRTPAARSGRRAEVLAVAGQLAADVAQRVLGAAALELVDRHGVGEVEHVDLLELADAAPNSGVIT